MAEKRSQLSKGTIDAFVVERGVGKGLPVAFLVELGNERPTSPLTDSVSPLASLASSFFFNSVALRDLSWYVL